MNNKFVGFCLITLIIVSLLLYPLWGLQLIFWSLLFVYIREKLYLRKTPRADTFFLDLIGFGYPLLEIVIKVFIIFNVIPYSWFWLNRFEHIFFSMFMTLLLFPLFVGTKRKPADYLLKIAAVVLFAGTMNEVFEFVVRSMQAGYSLRSGIYYSDTVYDEVMNIVGLFLGILLIRLKEQGIIKRSPRK